jgi:hypothetical protein
LFKQVMDVLARMLSSAPARSEQASAFAAVHFGFSCRIGELVHKPVTGARRERLMFLGRNPATEKEKGLRADSLAFIYSKGTPFVHAYNRPGACNLKAIGFFATSKRNQEGKTGARGCPTNPDPRYCPVVWLQRLVAKYPPSQRDYLFDTWPDKRHLERDLSMAMRRVAIDNGLDPKRFGPHCVRAGTIAAMQAHGSQPRDMAVRLGHSSTSSMSAYDNAGIREVLQLQPIIYDESVAPIDHLQFVYMPGASNFIHIQTQTYSDETQIDEEFEEEDD